MIEKETLSEKKQSALTTAVDHSGKDVYDYKPRAIIARITKEQLSIPEKEPLPSPWTIEIEPTLLCNSHCHFCSYEEDIKKFKDRIKEDINNDNKFGLSKNRVMSILSEIKQSNTTKGIFWSGGGEPLLWPYFTEAIKFTSTFSDNALQTNGYFLDKFIKNYENLSLIRLISISVYADNPNLHKIITKIDSFEKIINNIKKIISLKEKNGFNLTFGVKILVDRNNYKYLEEIVNFYQNLGLDTVGLRMVQDYNYGGIGSRKNSVELLPEQKEEIYQKINSLNKKNTLLYNFSKTLNYNAEVDNIITDHCYNAIDGHFACIDSWGDVFLGNPEIGDSNFKIGNINTQNWSEIWKSEKHFQVIELMDILEKNGKCKKSLCRHVMANIGTQEYLNGLAEIPNTRNVISSLGAFL